MTRSAPLFLLDELIKPAVTSFPAFALNVLERSSWTGASHLLAEAPAANCSSNVLRGATNHRHGLHPPKVSRLMSQAVTMTTCGRRRDVLPGLGDRGLRSRRGGGCHLHGDRGTRRKERGDPGSAVLMLRTSPETPPEERSEGRRRRGDRGGGRGQEEEEEEMTAKRWQRGRY